MTRALATAVALAVVAGGCDDTTGVLVRIHGAAPADQLSVTAKTTFGDRTHTLAAPVGSGWTMSFIATFRPDVGTVSFVVQPLVAGQPAGSCASAPVAVPPHRVVDGDVRCGPAGVDAGGGEDAAVADLSVGSISDMAGGYFAAVLADQPLAYYHLGEPDGGRARDASGNRQDAFYGDSVARHQPSLLLDAGALADGATGFPGGPGDAAQAVRYDGTGVLPKTALSIELWLSSAGGNQGAALAQFDYDGGNKIVPIYALTLQQNHLVFQVHAGVGTSQSMLTSNATVAVGAPHYVVATWDASTQAMSLWIDGALDASIGGISGDLIHGDPSSSGLGIGAGYNDGGAAAWNGVIDEVAIYGAALSAAQVQTHWARGQGH